MMAEMETLPALCLMEVIVVDENTKSPPVRITITIVLQPVSFTNKLFFNGQTEFLPSASVSVNLIPNQPKFP